MKFIYISLLAFTLILTSCKDASEINLENAENAKNVTTVCTMPDGRVLHRIRVVMQTEHDHYVYYFSKDDVSTVSINYSVKSGKTTRVQTIVLDGQEYTLKPTQPPTNE